MSENEGFMMSNLGLSSDVGSVSSISSIKSLRAPLIKMKCNNKVNSKCEIQQKITESVEKNLCRRVGLGQACRDGREDIVGRLLRGKMNTINNIDEDGMAALHYAARCNRVEILKMLLRAGADIDVKGSSKIHAMTPLLCAAKFNAIESSKVLIREGASVSAKNCYGQTALHHAVRRQNIKIVELLLTEGKMDVNVVDIDKTTALHIAAHVGDEMSTKLLLFHGIEIKAQDNDGFTAFHVAAREGKNDVLRTLLQTARDHKMDTTMLLDMPDNYGNTCLHLAVKHGRCSTTQICLNFGASLCVWESSSLQTPLHFAAVSGNLCVLRALFEGKDLDLHAEDGDGMTPVLRASLEGNRDVIEYLLDQGAHVNAPPNTGFPSPLMCAVKRDQHKTMKFLLSKGAQVDQIDTQWRNCLHIAAACSDPKTLRILLEKDTKHLVGKRDAYGKTPLHYAALRCSHVGKIIQLLTDAGGLVISCDNDERIPLHYAARAGIVVSTRSLLEVSPESLNCADTLSQTPLHVAAANGQAEVCRLLLENKAEVDYRDDLRLTPLFHAVIHGCPRTIRVLVDYGADIDAVEKSRKTPLIVAAFEGKIDAFKTLLECGADISIVCGTGFNVLDAALAQDQLNICTEIVRHERWRDVMGNLKFNQVSPMKRLIEKFPSLAKVVMDKCITESTSIETDKNYAIEYDFQYLCPKPGEEIDSDGKRYFGPKLMLENEREDLLRHPLTKSLMATKWRSVGVNFFYIGFVIYSMFVGCLSHYMYCMHKFDMNKATGVIVKTHCSKDSIYISEIVLVSFSALNLLYECYQLYTERSKYFDLTNVLQVSTYVCAIIAVYPVNGDREICGMAGWNAGVIGVLLSFLTILQYIQCLLSAGIYVTMLFEVLKSLLKVLAMFSLLIVGFGLVFVYVMDGSPPFNNYWGAMIKVFAMTIGEIDYSTYFVQGNGPKRYTLALGVFLVFSLLMPIALMNLLIGLAVGDIDSVQNHAELKMMSTEIEVVYEFEEKMPVMLRERLHKSKLVVHPNKQHGLKVLKKYLGQIGTVQEIVRLRNESVDKDNTRRDLLINRIVNQVDITGERINEITKQLEDHRILLEGIVSTLTVDKTVESQTSQEEEDQKALLEMKSILGRL
ncbi:transient receptor potential cation channel subfamily A member 1 isoform X2 [Exaiptasia diaphana]|uniref:Ion transport domain-containing protein n=1 Tax=Exaiptasia diaphana TaxID=2652724 RepID=A0A913X661_EXADI|nr:transient receptor potential cation channel subfamily A member 1 isoform X2 [Exaiptasia diaphana]